LLFEGAGHDVLAAVDNADRLRAAVSEHTPDLAVVDVRMPPSFSDEGIRAAGWIRDAHPEVGVLMLSQHVESAGAVGLVTEGGFGYRAGSRARGAPSLCRQRSSDRGEQRGHRRSAGGEALARGADEIVLADPRASGLGRLELRRLRRRSPVAISAGRAGR